MAKDNNSIEQQFDWANDKSSFFQDRSGKLSLGETWQNCRDGVFAFSCIGLFLFCAVAAFDNWGFLLGATVGLLLSGVLGFAMFAVGMKWEGFRTMVFVPVSFVLLMFGLAAFGVTV